MGGIMMCVRSIALMQEKGRRMQFHQKEGPRNRRARKPTLFPTLSLSLDWADRPSLRTRKLRAVQVRSRCEQKIYLCVYTGTGAKNNWRQKRRELGESLLLLQTWTKDSTLRNNEQPWQGNGREPTAANRNNTRNVFIRNFNVFFHVPILHAH